MNPKFVIKLDIHTKLSGGKFPVVIQITWDKKVRKKRIKGYSCSKENWDFEENRYSYLEPKSHKKNEHIEVFLAKCKKVARQNFFDDFNYPKFSELLQEGDKKAEVKEMTVTDFCFEVMKEKIEDGAVGSANNYKGLASALDKAFDKKVWLSDFGIYHIRKFANNLRERGCKGYNYLKFLKILYNKAIKKGYVDGKNCPFKNEFNRDGFDISKYKNKPSNFINKNRIKDLSEDEIKMVVDYYRTKTISEKEHKYLSIWMLSYFFFGVNFIDIAKMKWSDIQNGYWMYSRSKTGVTNELGKPIHEEAMAIMKRHDSGGKYIFDISNGFDHDPEIFHKRLSDYKSRTGKCYKRISKRLGFEGDRYFTFYSGRYTAPTIALGNGVDVNTVKTLMDHKNIKTTNRYLGMVKDKEKLANAINILDMVSK